MSHIGALKEAKDVCDRTGDCAGLESLVVQEEAEHQSVKESETLDVLLVGGGVLLFLLAFVLISSVRKLVVRLGYRLLPAVFIGGAGFFVGFVIGLGACFKQACSLLEESAMFLLGAGGIIVGLAVYWLVLRRWEDRFFDRVSDIQERTWKRFGIGGGVLITILLAIALFEIYRRAPVYLDYL